ncbi:SpoIIIAH-like family protein [Paenibacillus sp. HN-1]|uniref:SpoIIIAH-like family protein n=1 Tax=Paenibacillus TaxID=44249 RepID=UPI001CA9E03D|nr:MULTISPECIES: SpoIIIAH-like family protein [Paenibacillus]MBY9081495.1 SpoIIIAH-like family protein [Paenibacillus sp. CGMCC 1.18879]MBY9085015.1 SpoIIIAH-like family protein [Paenibacillus sinensis]
MNGKRQTIWLVSMLSLMVVLSAYYLFTEDSGVSSPKETAGTIQVDSVKNGGSTLADGGATVSEVTPQDAASANDSTASAGQSASNDNTAAADNGSTASADGKTTADASSAAAGDNGAASAEGTGSSKEAITPSAPAASQSPAASASASPKATASAGKTGSDKSTSAGDDSGVSKKDAAVLDQVASQSASASSMFTNYLYEREQNNLKEQNDLMAVINNMDKTPEESAAAQQQLNKLEEKESKITSIEEQLQQQYGDAIVKEEGEDTYKVVVLSDKLNVKQAAGIIDLIMKELSVSQDKVSVQHVSEQ